MEKKRGIIEILKIYKTQSSVPHELEVDLILDVTQTS